MSLRWIDDYVGQLLLINCLNLCISFCLLVILWLCIHFLIDDDLRYLLISQYHIHSLGLTDLPFLNLLLLIYLSNFIRYCCYLGWISLYWFLNSRWLLFSGRWLGRCWYGCLLNCLDNFGLILMDNFGLIWMGRLKLLRLLRLLVKLSWLVCCWLWNELVGLIGLWWGDSRLGNLSILSLGRLFWLFK